MPSGKVVTSVQGTSVLAFAEQAELPIAAPCSGDLVCGKCNVQVVEGHGNLSKQSARERSLLKKEGRRTTDRLSCRTAVFGDCTITTEYW